MWRGRPRPRLTYVEYVAEAEVQVSASFASSSGRQQADFCNVSHIWTLDSSQWARDIVFDCCRSEPRIEPIALVGMPDHVHVIFAPTRDAAGHNYALPEIMQSLKSSSAHKINKLLCRRGPVWDEEFFDHAIRSPEALPGKIEYVLFNPVQNRLAARPSEYRWAWTEIAFADEGVRATP